jgi:hypothetical protein
VRGVVLVPGRDAAAAPCRNPEAIVVDDVRAVGDETLGERDDGLQVKQLEVGLARLEHAMVQLNEAAGVLAVLSQRPVEVGAHRIAPLRRGDVVQNEVAVAVESLHPFVELGITDQSSVHRNSFSNYSLYPSP